MKLSDLQKALADAGVDEATARAVVDDQLQAGKIEDDLAVDDAALDAHMDAVAKAMSAEGETDDDDPEIDPLAKGDDEYDFGDGFDPDDDPDLEAEAEPGLPFAVVVDEIAKGAQAIVEDVTAKHEVLAKAYLDMAKTAKAMTKGLEVISQRLGRMEKALGGKLSELEKAMDQPVPPRAQDLETIPHPGDGNGQGDDADSRDDVINKAMAKLRASDDQQEKYLLKSAIAQLEMPGANHTAIAKGLGL